jgi:hypothetical protein
VTTAKFPLSHSLPSYVPFSFALWQPLGFLAKRDLDSLCCTCEQLGRFVELFELPKLSRNRQRSFRHWWIRACSEKLSRFKLALLEALPHPDTEASLALKRALGDASRCGAMPCFNNIEALSGYIAQRLGTRSI